MPQSYERTGLVIVIHGFDARRIGYIVESLKTEFENGFFRSARKGFPPNRVTEVHFRSTAVAEQALAWLKDQDRKSAQEADD